MDHWFMGNARRTHDSLRYGYTNSFFWIFMAYIWGVGGNAGMHFQNVLVFLWINQALFLRKKEAW
jgi:hypothetical protein